MYRGKKNRFRREGEADREARGLDSRRRTVRKKDLGKSER